MPDEIERKWLIADIAIEEYELLSQEYVEQAYISVNPEVRIRNRNHSVFLLTLKDNGSLVRKEIETTIDQSQYEEILQYLIGKPPIIKKCRKYRLQDSLILEVSEVDGGELVYAEVEFSSVQAAKEFQAMPFMGEEVSDKPEYRMKAYWARTRG